MWLMCGVSSLVVFFFCKQKTAYEMRISDWSSDVCSSDLKAGPHFFEQAFRGVCVGIERERYRPGFPCEAHRPRVESANPGNHFPQFGQLLLGGRLQPFDLAEGDQMMLIQGLVDDALIIGHRHPILVACATPPGTVWQRQARGEQRDRRSHGLGTSCRLTFSSAQWKYRR